MLKERGLKLFIAIDIPTTAIGKVRWTRRDLERIEGIRFVDDRTLHITLKFLGAIDPKKLGKVETALREIKFSPFRIKLAGVGAFPSMQYMRALWVGCRSAKLDRLAQKINDALEGTFPKEQFVPHATIARVIKRISLRDFMIKYGSYDFGNFDCSYFELKSSEMTKAGPAYTTLSRYQASAPESSEVL